MDLEAFELVLLRRPPDARAYPDDDLERIQAEHLAYHAKLREAGHIVTNGPVREQPDPSLRGLTFYRTGFPGKGPAACRGRSGRPRGAARRRDHDVVLPARHYAPAGARRLAPVSPAIAPQQCFPRTAARASCPG